MTRNVFGVHTDVNGMNQDMISVSALIKVLFEPKDAAIVRSRRSWAHPEAYWLYRSPKDQDATQPPGELQARYDAATTRQQAEGVAKWYAAWLASWMFDAGVDYMFVEGGPNEQDPTTTEEIMKAVYYSAAFVREAVYLGLRPAPGMYSFGKPGSIKWDGVDGWAPWQPVFDVIDGANAGQSVPRAAFQLHNYAINQNMIDSIDFAIGRYPPTDRYVGPIVIGELGWSNADGGRPPSTEEKVRQLCDLNARLGQDDRMMGWALWDCRSIATEQDRFDYMYSDLVRGLREQALPTQPITVHVRPIIPVPPIPDPDPDPEPDPDPSGPLPVVITSQYGVNCRAQATSNSSKLGFLGQGAEVVAEYPSINEYIKVQGTNFWIWSRNVTIKE